MQKSFLTTHQRACRIQVINYIYNSRQRFGDITRATLTQAVCIFDKCIQSGLFVENLEMTHLDISVIGLTCILIASKFSDVHSLKVKRITQTCKEDGLETELILDQEQSILEALDFDIPMESIYTGFEKYLVENCTQSKNRNCHIRALKFLKEAIKENENLSWNS